jgi:lysophospholipase L1-like esterase
MAVGHFQALFLGDSVVWGQGLTDAEKFSSQLVAWINQYHPTQNAYKTVLAHSGAVIGVGSTVQTPALDGEVPTNYPTILQQCQQVQGDPLDVDLVVVNGGINDVGVEYIFNAYTDQQELADAIQRFCRKDLATLLAQVANRFSNPKTSILVPGYYPVLSTQSDPFRIPTLLPLFGVSLSALIFPSNPVAKIVSNSLLFWKDSIAAMTNAVADVNTQLGANRIVFVQPDITEVNSAFAPAPWVFAVNADLSPQDDVIAARHAVCVRDETDLVQREFCYRASAGHPNRWGAQAFFKALYPVLQQRYGF